ncbi:hypothetical protein FRC12_015800 [Ceratobasidium sp. 428]|nr:hypothetical protein FRC12_015800 [Ceratobasidium sp. 428]
MDDPQDRRMADLFELELRRKAELDSGNEWELVWFLRLPLETRCSYMRILEARIDQDRPREALRRQSFHRHDNWRQPRPTQTVHCMNMEVAQPWQSIGRRQRRRKHKLRSSLRNRRRAPDHRFTPRHVRFQFPAPHGSTSPIIIDPIDIPGRPMTPPGLREWIMGDQLGVAKYEYSNIKSSPDHLNPFRRVMILISRCIDSVLYYGISYWITITGPEFRSKSRQVPSETHLKPSLTGYKTANCFNKYKLVVRQQKFALGEQLPDQNTRSRNAKLISGDTTKGGEVKLIFPKFSV